MSSLIVQRGVADDLRQISEFIAKDNPQAARRFLRAARSDFVRIAEMPGVGGPIEINIRWMANMRVLPITGFENYIILYRECHDQVEIVYVVYGGRELEKLRSR